MKTNLVELDPRSFGDQGGGAGTDDEIDSNSFSQVESRSEAHLRASAELIGGAVLLLPNDPSLSGQEWTHHVAA